MRRFHIYSQCNDYRCDGREKKELFHVDSYEEAREHSKKLDKETTDVCEICGSELQHFFWTELVMTEEVVNKINGIRNVLQNLVDSSNDELVLKEPKKDLFDGEIKDEKIFALVSKKEERSYEAYREVFGDVATIFFEGKGIAIHIGTNHFNKKVIYELVRKFGMVEPDWSYDQLRAPEWTFWWDLEDVQTLSSFLQDAWSLSQTYPRVYGEKKEYIFAIVERQDRENKKVNVIQFMEKDDWNAFHSFVYEHYHTRMEHIQDLVKKLDLKDGYDSTFKSYLSKEELTKEFSSHPYFEFNEEFQKYIEDEEKERQQQ